MYIWILIKNVIFLINILTYLFCHLFIKITSGNIVRSSHSKGNYVYHSGGVVGCNISFIPLSAGVVELKTSCFARSF